MNVLLVAVLAATPVPPDAFLLVIGKGSTVRVTTRAGKTVLGEVIEETKTGLVIKNGPAKEPLPFVEIVDMVELSGPAPAPVAVVAAPLVPEVEGPPPPPPPPPPPDSSFALRFGLGGAVCWGLTIGADLELFSKFGLFAELRMTNIGLLSNFSDSPVFGISRSRDTNQSAAYRVGTNYGLGGTLGVERFFGDRKGLRGMYVAAGFETIFRFAAVENVGLSFFVWVPGNLNQFYLVPHARFGYRWRFWRILLALGARVGAGFLVGSTYSSRPYLQGFPATTRPWGSSQRAHFDAADKDCPSGVACAYDDVCRPSCATRAQCPSAPFNTTSCYGKLCFADCDGPTDFCPGSTRCKAYCK